MSTRTSTSGRRSNNKALCLHSLDTRDRLSVSHSSVDSNGSSSTKISRVALEGEVFDHSAFVITDTCDCDATMGLEAVEVRPCVYRRGRLRWSDWGGRWS